MSFSISLFMKSKLFKFLLSIMCLILIAFSIYKKPSQFVTITLLSGSKCPDSKFAFDAIMPLSSKLGSITRFDIEYVGSIEDSYISCYNGIQECKGNIQQLCVRNYYPDALDWMPFIDCQNNALESKIPSLDLYNNCTNLLELDQKMLDSCVDTNFGKSLLRQSILKTLKFSHPKTGAIFIDRKLSCIRKFGKWTECALNDDFEAAICLAYEVKYKTRPDICNDIT